MSDSSVNIVKSGVIWCPSCRADVICNDPARSRYFGCNTCGTYFEYVAGQQATDLKADLKGRSHVPALPIGATGRLNDKDYIVTGFLVKKDIASGIVWREYLLFLMGQEGYTTLAEYRGHWMVIDKANEESFNITRTENYDWVVTRKWSLKAYPIYTSYKFRIVAARGEFDWDIMEDSERLFVQEFTNPPEIVVVETLGEKEYNWYEGEYVQPATVAEAFGVEMKKLPPRIGVGAIEPHSSDIQAVPMRKFTVFMLCLVLVSHFVITLGKPSAVVLSETHSTLPDSAAWGGGGMTPIKTSTFNITRSGAVDLEMSSDLSNEWIELPLSLINESTGKEYEFPVTLEYWSGYDGGESWSEGRRDFSAVISAVPPGKYHVSVYPYSELKRETLVGIKVEECTPLYSNMLWFCLILLGAAAIHYFWAESVKAQRQS